MAPLVRALREEPAIEAMVCLTGQHRRMLQQVLDVFDITAEYDLDVMTENQSLNALASRVLHSLDDVLADARPDRVLVHGDTTTASAAALAAFHRRIPVAHVEAGLRTGNLRQPWPEEMNRRVVDMLSDLRFAPTHVAAANLAREQLPGKTVVTGNTVIDALKLATSRIDASAVLRTSLDERIAFIHPGQPLILVTGHRRESFGRGFEQICAALADIAHAREVQIVYPVHLNPNVQETVRRVLHGIPNVHLIAPQNYMGFMRLLQRAAIVLTDSGGVQEEAPALGKPVLVMRDVTERPEAVEAGTARLVGTQRQSIFDAVIELVDNPQSRAAYARRVNPYGDGQASARIVAALAGRAFEEFDVRETVRAA
ncbi:UDP-N-acetylglucosamine 2-epimerase [Pararobbsia alpina]|uniref:non-hydrolyzing UDP-N-acetylglucosamine 2-epimerase n=1 Tax=Pararobbsia alpina TaxID=621374 RepID=UPI0039A59972